MPVDPIVETWWTPWQVKLVTDRERVWRRVRFEPADTVRHRASGAWVARKAAPGEQPTPESELVSGGWDHEHCSLCWAKISMNDADDAVGYTEGKDWLCTQCFEKYVAPRVQTG